MIRRCDCGVDVLVAVGDHGGPITLDIGPAPGTWLRVWQDGRYVRAATLTAPPEAVPHQPHRCNVSSDGRPADVSLLGTAGPRRHLASWHNAVVVLID